MPLVREFEGYLVVSPKGWSGLSGRLTSKSPALKPNEQVVKLSVQVPDALFKRPQLKASIVIPESSVSSPVIDATVLDNVREILCQQTGLDVSVSLVTPLKECIDAAD